MIPGCHYIVGQKGATPSLRTFDRTHTVVDSDRMTPDSMLPVKSHCDFHINQIHIIKVGQIHRYGTQSNFKISFWHKEERPGSANSDYNNSRFLFLRTKIKVYYN